MKQKERELKKKAIKWGILFSVMFLLADLVYKTIFNITYTNRENCILYKALPRWGFMFFEYFIELVIVVIVGIFLATLLERYFTRYGKYYPKNPFTSFLYASMIPVCACSAIPLIRTLRDKLDMKTIVAFIVSAPLLSPYIIVLSFSVLGVKYGILRIVCSFILAISTGYVVQLFCARSKAIKLEQLKMCDKKSCFSSKKDVYTDTYNIFKEIFPYILVAGVITLGFEYLVPKQALMGINFANSPLGLLLVVLAGVPFYFCNGVEVLILRPLIDVGGFSLGTSLAFSLTATSICVTSIIMLFKFLGKRTTMVLIGNVVVVTWVMSYLINLLL